MVKGASGEPRVRPSASAVRSGISPEPRVRFPATTNPTTTIRAPAPTMRTAHQPRRRRRGRQRLGACFLGLVAAIYVLRQVTKPEPSGPAMRAVGPLRRLPSQARRMAGGGKGPNGLDYRLASFRKRPRLPQVRRG